MQTHFGAQMMNNLPTTVSLKSSTRLACRGVATLELVLCMPILLLLMVGIVWLGFSVIGQARVTVSARHDAWDDRFEAGEGRPFVFLTDGIVTGNADEEVNVSSMFDDVGSPESKHVVMQGSWDHRSLPLDTFPNWQRYAEVAVNAKTLGLQVAYTDARSMINQLTSSLGGASGPLALVSQLIKDQLTNPLGNLDSAVGGANQEVDRASAELRAKLTAQAAGLTKDLEAAKDLLEELKKEDEEADESIEFRKEVQENRIKRLRAELKRIRSDLTELPN